MQKNLLPHRYLFPVNDRSTSPSQFDPCSFDIDILSWSSNYSKFQVLSCFSRIKIFRVTHINIQSFLCSHNFSQLSTLTAQRKKIIGKSGKILVGAMDRTRSLQVTETIFFLLVLTWFC